jgi:hypothetical protein
MACRPGFFLPVRVLSRVFRRVFLDMLEQAHQRDQLNFFGELASLAHRAHFAGYLRAMRDIEWVV